MEEDANGPETTILDLPDEVLGKIFNKLGQTEVPQLCLVSRKFKGAVEGYYNFTVSDLDEDSHQIERILSLRIVSLQKIKKLKHKQIQILPIESEPEMWKPQLVLKFPKTIQRILITKRCNISISNLAGLLQLCQKNVTELDIHLKPPLSSSLSPFSYIYKFDKLELLNLTLKGEKKGGNNSNNHESLLYQLAHSKFKNLKEINIDAIGPVPVVQCSSILSLLLRLATKNPGGLESLSIELISKGFGNIPDVPETGELVGLLASVRNLKSICLTGSANNSFLDLIRRQRKLESIHLGYHFEISPALIHIIISNGFQTLVSVHFSKLNVSGDRPLDLSVFKHCLSLEFLNLQKTYPSTTPDQDPHGPDLINFDSFPPNLTTMWLLGFNILSTDLGVLLDSDALLTLHELFISYPSSSDAYLPGFGANSTVLEKVASLELENRNLESLDLDWNSTADPEEIANCRPILERLGYSLEEARSKRFLTLGPNGNNLYRQCSDRFNFSDSTYV